jgi:tRNA dimethylallyltransferase
VKIGNRVVALFGPTAVGKTEAAIIAAKELNAEIVSIDSRQIYRGMNIGTAKPTAGQRSQVPHHLIDVADPENPWSLVDYFQAVNKAIDEIHQRHHLPILVGGTGQYFSAILEGWQPPPKMEDIKLRQELEAYAEKHGSIALHARLEEIDPLSAQRIDHRNVRRVVRALEICHVSGVPASSIRRKEQPPYNFLRIGLKMPRKELYERIDARIDAMIEAGFVDEVKALLERGIDPRGVAMSAIGYKQIAEHLSGDSTLDEVIQQIRKTTRQFVRRQANWFKPDDKQITWLDAGPEAGKALIKIISAWIADKD